jgi:predicted phosphohydrolase
MKIWAISDLHLSGAKPKPMDIFGSQWKNHPQKIAKTWRERVAPEDLVLCPGDLSWAMTVEDAMPDLAYFDSLPGKKILMRGNHDFWWKRKETKKIQASAPSSLLLLQGNAFAPSPDVVIIGARGWRFPGERTIGDDDIGASKMGHAGNVSSESQEQDDAKITQRELESLKSSIKDARRFGLTGKFVIAMMHYPPWNLSGAPSAYTKLLSEAGARLCIYGHLHGEDTKHARQGIINGIEYRLVSADAVDFQPVRLL